MVVTKLFCQCIICESKLKIILKNDYQGLNIQYAIEQEPLGTGGAIVNALSLIEDKQQSVFVLNGDSFIELDYQAMFAKYQHELLSIALRQIPDCSRYGKVIVNDNNEIIHFQEKGKASDGLINAGVYLLKPKIFESYLFANTFSFETDFLLKWHRHVNAKAFITNGYFIDIGIPEDYLSANHDLAKVVNSDMS